MFRKIAPLLAALCLVVPASAQADTYGNATAGDYLANLEVGRYPRQVDYRFRAEASGNLSSVGVFLIRGSGYSAGDGGTISVRLEGDNAGQPNGVVAGSGTISDPLSGSGYRTVSISNSSALVAGQVYHLHFVNTDPSPTTNWVSVDDMAVDQPGSQRQPTIPDSDLAALYKDGGSWTTAARHTPVFALHYADGSDHGPGVAYVNARSQSARYAIVGSSRVAQSMTPTSTLTVTAARVRINKTGTPGALTAGIHGTTATVPASSIPAGTSWVTFTFPTPVTMNAGTTYRLSVYTGSASGYSAWPLTEGPAALDSPSKFTEGAAQTYNGSTWSTPSGADDLQAYVITQ